MDEKIWLKSYPDYVPKQLPLLPFHNLSEFIEECCTMFKHEIAFSHFGHDMTYGEVWYRSVAFAGYLQQELGVKKGERVAIMLPNCIDYPISIYACFIIGAVIVNVNPLYKADELLHQLTDADVSTVIVVDLCLDALQQVKNKLSIKNLIVTSIADLIPAPKSWLIQAVLTLSGKVSSIAGSITFKKCLSEGKKYTLTKVATNKDDLAFLQYTGGTTGLAKGAKLSHANILANIAQAYAWFGHYFEERKEISVLALPLYHIFSLTINLLAMNRVGGRSVVITNPRDFNGFIKTLKKYRFSVFSGVNTLFAKLLREQNFRKLDFSSLKCVIAGGMTVQQDVALEWQHVTNVSILQGYGLSETSPLVSVNIIGSKFNGSIGLPVPGTDVDFFDDSGRAVKQGELGELGIKGPQVMQGYWGEAKHDCFNDSAYFLTGDIGYIDEKGLMFLKERKKDLIVVSGFNVYPTEIEMRLDHHPNIVESAVVAVPFRSCGEAPKAFVVSNKKLTEQEVIQWCREGLADYKVPKFVEFKDELPKSPVGKILKKELRQ